MTWKDDDNVKLIREILLYEPWKYKHGSVELGQIWRRIAESPCILEEPKFKVDDRAVRKRINLLIKEFKKKENDERVATGIAPEEEQEVDIGIRNIKLSQQTRSRS